MQLSLMQNTNSISKCQGRFGMINSPFRDHVQDLIKYLTDSLLEAVNTAY